MPRFDHELTEAEIQLIIESVEQQRDHAANQYREDDVTELDALLEKLGNWS